MPASTRDVLLRAAPAGDLVDELVAARRGLHLDGDLGELAGAARLLLVGVGHLLDRLGDGLAVGDLRLAHGGVDPELARHPVDDDLEVQLAHAEMTVWPVSSSVRTWKVGSSSDSACALPIFSWSTGLGLDGHVDDRLGELELLELDLAARRRQRVAGAGVLQADACGDVAGEDGVDVFPVVGVHLQDAADALLASRWSC